MFHCVNCGEPFIPFGPRYKGKDGKWHTPGKFYHDAHCFCTVLDTEKNAMRRPEKQEPIDGYCYICGKPIQVEYARSGYTLSNKVCSAECFNKYCEKDRFIVLHILDITPKDMEFCIDKAFHKPVGLFFHKREGYLLSERVLRAPAIDVYVKDGAIHFSLALSFDIAAWRRRCK